MSRLPLCILLRIFILDVLKTKQWWDSESIFSPRSLHDAREIRNRDRNHCDGYTLATKNKWPTRLSPGVLLTRNNQQFSWSLWFRPACLHFKFQCGAVCVKYRFLIISYVTCVALQEVIVVIVAISFIRLLLEECLKFYFRDAMVTSAARDWWDSQFVAVSVTTLLLPYERFTLTFAKLRLFKISWRVTLILNN